MNCHIPVPFETREVAVIFSIELRKVLPSSFLPAKTYTWPERKQAAAADLALFTGGRLTPHVLDDKLWLETERRFLPAIARICSSTLTSAAIYLAVSEAALDL